MINKMHAFRSLAINKKQSSRRHQSLQQLWRDFSATIFPSKSSLHSSVLSSELPVSCKDFVLAASLRSIADYRFCKDNCLSLPTSSRVFLTCQRAPVKSN